MQAKPGDIVCPAVMGTSMEQAKMRVLIDPTYYDYQVKTTTLLMTAFASCPSECSLQQHGCALSCWTPQMHICCGGSASCTMQPVRHPAHPQEQLETSLLLEFAACSKHKPVNTGSPQQMHASLK